MINKKHVWLCIIVCEGEVPEAGDSPPRFAVEKAIKKMGLKIITNSTGWNVLNVDG